MLLANRPKSPELRGFLGTSQKELEAGEFLVGFSLITQRSPRMIKQLTETVVTVLPTKDPESVITASYINEAEVRLLSNGLKVARIEITLDKQTYVKYHI